MSTAKSNKATTVNVTVDTTGASVTEPTTEIETVDTTVGRPIELTSKRQKDLLEKELKRQQGLLHKGRPIDLGSVRQERLAEMEERKLNGEEIKPGRPKFTAAEKVIADGIKKAKKEEEMKVIKAMAAQMLAAQNIKTEAPAEAAIS